MDAFDGPGMLLTGVLVRCMEKRESHLAGKLVQTRYWKSVKALSAA